MHSLAGGNSPFDRKTVPDTRENEHLLKIDGDTPIIQATMPLTRYRREVRICVEHRIDSILALFHDDYCIALFSRHGTSCGNMTHRVYTPCPPVEPVVKCCCGSLGVALVL